MADATIRIKLGELEVDYQGDATFLKNDLIATVKELLELQIVAQQQYSSGTDRGAVDSRQSETRGDAPGDRKFDHSTDTIPNILGAKSGSDLALAAAAHLHFKQEKETFTRKQITNEMRGAGHWKKSYGSNLTTYIETLKSKDQLRERSKNIFVACTRFRRHRVRCFDGAGGGSWRDGSLPASSSLRLCA
jgi:hypothetical protein